MCFQSCNMLRRWNIWAYLFRHLAIPIGVTRRLLGRIGGSLAKGYRIDRGEVVFHRRMKCLLTVGLIRLQHFILCRPLQSLPISRTIIATLGTIFTGLARASVSRCKRVMSRPSILDHHLETTVSSCLRQELTGRVSSHFSYHLQVSLLQREGIQMGCALPHYSLS